MFCGLDLFCFENICFLWKKPQQKTKPQVGMKGFQAKKESQGPGQPLDYQFR